MTDETLPAGFLPDWAQEALALVQGEIEAGLPAAVRTPGDGATPVSILPNPAPLRPYLLLAVSRHYGCTGPRPIRMAAAVQMIHIASLLHERLGDLGPARPARGPEVQKVRHHQESLDILLGDFCFSWASGIIIADGEQRIIEDMIQTSQASAEAQALIAGFQGRGESGPPGRCFTARADKVSLLIALALRTGANLGAAPEEEKAALSDFGLLLGKAMRIVEDLGLWTNSPGAVPARRRELKYSHPLLMLWEREGRDAWENAVARLEGEEPGVVPDLWALLRRHGCPEASLQAARSHSRMARERLEGQAGLAGLEELRELAGTRLCRMPAEFGEALG